MHMTEQERDAVYKTIFNRRDVRGEFTSQAIDDEALLRILTAAHHAPSVGFMQPWDFIVVQDPSVKQAIKNGFELSHKKAAEMFDGDRRAQYKKLKLEGIMEAPIGICVTCDRTRTGPVVIGRTQNPEMDLYSSVCAVMNLWLAARAENLGLGWVSIIDHDVVRQSLNIPEHITPIAWLCLGHVSKFHDKPELEKANWLPRLKLEQVIHKERWQN